MLRLIFVADINYENVFTFSRFTVSCALLGPDGAWISGEGLIDIVIVFLFQPLQVDLWTTWRTQKALVFDR